MAHPLPGHPEYSSTAGEGNSFTVGRNSHRTHTAPAAGVAAAPKDAGAAQHISYSCPSTCQGTASFGTNWGSQLRGEEEMAGPAGERHSRDTKPQTAHLTVRLLSARTWVQTVVCKGRHAEGWRGRS